MVAQEADENTFKLAIKAATAGADLLADRWQKPQTALAEMDHDIKLAADREAESAILAVLDESPWPRLAEESGVQGDCTAKDALYWVVDPLDGTINFSRGIPFCCVSVALCRGDTPLLGVICDFIHQETFSGWVGRGAWCNGKPIGVSAAQTARRGLLGMGHPLGFEYDTAGLAAIYADQRRFSKVRQIGSAALLLAWVASGRIDAYLEDDIMFWDIAAGAALVKAAGGWVAMVPSIRGGWARKIRAAASPAVWETTA